MWADILAFAVGVWFLQQQAALPALYLASMLLPLPLLLFGLRRADSPALKWLRRTLRAGLWLGAGFFWAALVAQWRLADVLPEAWEGRDIRLTGVVAALPTAGDHALRFDFDVESVQTANAKVPAHIRLSWFSGGFGRPAAHPVPALQPGERWAVTVRLKRPHSTADPYGFDYEAALLESNLRATGYVRDAEDNRRLAARVYRPAYLIESARAWGARRIDRVLGGRPYAGVLKALAIGDQASISPPQWQVFIRTGVNHLMSISGLHVTMISSAAFAAVYWLWRRSARLTLRLPARKAAVIAGVAAALAYALLSGFGVPTQRTLYMLGTMAVALWLGRTGSASTVLSLALLTVLLLDPWAVMSPGFWLSFGAVAAILYVSVGRVGEPHWLAEWGRVQWAVTVGLVPALLAIFQQLSLISPLANAVAIPVVSFVVTPLTLLGTVLPVDFLLLGAHLAMSWCMAFLEWLSAVPGAVWQQHGPPPWTVVAGMGGVVWLLLPRGFPARWLGALWLVPMFAVPPPQPAGRELWVTVLDVGQGLATVVRTRHHALLFDTGPPYGNGADAGSRVVVPFLRGNGVAKLDTLIVSHSDSDHAGGAVSVLRSLPVDRTLTSMARDNPLIAGAGVVVPCFAGQSWDWDGVRFEVLHPSRESYGVQGLKTNDRSCVLKASSPFGSVLLPGDAEARSEKQMIHRSPDGLRAEVLVASHHGSRNASSAPFLDAVQPSIGVFSAGYRNRFGHPAEEVVERFYARHARITRTDRDGALEIDFGSGGISVQGWRQKNRRYWQSP